MVKNKRRSRFEKSKKNLSYFIKLSFIYNSIKKYKIIWVLNNKICIFLKYFYYLLDYLNYFNKKNYINKKIIFKLFYYFFSLYYKFFFFFFFNEF